ncbi:MAG: hypothetical protein O3A39_08905 [Proteobacteria bacterium]|nr:hypothetical protein [Pseudomonadota bacterium]
MFLIFISLIFTAITEKNNNKIACLGFNVNHKIGSAIRGRPKLITPFKKPPTDNANNIINIEYKSRFCNI